MSRYISHINTVKRILGLYKGDIPFSHFIKQFFAADKKYGSRDRRNISHYAYVYFRVAALLKEATVEEVVLKGLFLCTNEPREEFPGAWNAHIDDPLPEKMEFLGLHNGRIFPFHELLSDQIDHQAFAHSLLSQPSVFIRIRPGCGQKVIQQLSEKEIPFLKTGDDTLELTSGTDLRDIPGKDKDFIIQDLSSQQVMDFLPQLFPGDDRVEVWDCCAGSGGKSILLWDRLGGKANITATDVRDSILRNYRVRLASADIPAKECRVADLATGHLAGKKFSLIVCDAPCTGSGTWSRTPEQIAFFDPASLSEFSIRQRSIVRHSAASLLPGGYYLYITCSVFSGENEEIAGFIQKELGLKMLRSEYIKGYNKKADSMYLALFQLPPTP